MALKRKRIVTVMDKARQDVIIMTRGKEILQVGGVMS